jgi:hypothetical protein
MRDRGGRTRPTVPIIRTTTLFFEHHRWEGAQMRFAGALTVGLAAILAVAVAPMSPARAADPVPLPAPGKPVVSNLTATGATLTWAHSAGPVFRYSMRRLVDGAWQGYASMPSNTFTLAGLVPGETYTFAVQSHALPGSGYTSSPLSEPVTVTPAGPPAWDCRIDFWTWSGGYTAAGSLSGQVGFTTSGTMTISHGWNGTFSVSGDRVTISANGRFGFSGGLTGPFTGPSNVQPACEIWVDGRLAEATADAADRVRAG